METGAVPLALESVPDARTKITRARADEIGARDDGGRIMTRGAASLCRSHVRLQNDVRTQAKAA